jgi:hypothetical protein
MQAFALCFPRYWSRHGFTSPCVITFTLVFLRPCPGAHPGYAPVFNPRLKNTSNQVMKGESVEASH